MKLHYKKYTLAHGVQKVKTKTAIVLSAFGLLFGSGAGLALTMFGSANAVVSNTYTLFDDATIVSDGNPGNAVQLVWSSSSSQTDGGVDFGVPSTLTVGGLNNLSTDYKFTAGTCSQGSPRFQVNVLGKNVFAYLGPQFPSTSPCATTTYSNSTNVVSPTSMVDATQLGNGYETWAAFQSQHTTDAVTGIQLVVDGFTTPNITAQFDNTQINDTTYTYEPVQTKDNCKNNGWKTMTDASGRKFKNQGDCVSYFATGGLNMAAGPKAGTSQATGNLTLTSPTQTLNFAVHDNGTSAVDTGTVTYSNPGVSLTYTVPTTCVNVSGNTAYFAYQIPNDAPVAANVWVVWKVADNGTSDTAGFTTAADGAGANALCEAGSASVTNYPITSGDVKVS